MALTDRLSVRTRRETKIAYKACEWKRIASTYMTNHNYILTMFLSKLLVLI